FRFSADNARVQEINLNTTYTNKDYMRQVLAFDAYDAAGLPASEAFAVRVNRSGEFYSVSVLVEQPDEDMLSREGLDPNGALYKMYNAFTSGSSSVEKKTRQYEGNADLIEFVTQINSLAGEQLRNYVFDNVNIPSVLNYLATTAIIQNNDQMAKNYYLYRDSNGTGEWSILPWDLDLTFGLHFMSNDSILDDVIWADKDNFTTFAGVTIWPSHPFVGDQEHPANRNWNRLIDALYEVPEFREMYLRRLRTLMDELLQAPGTAMENRYFETQIDNYAQQMAADVQLDYDKWANPWQWGNDESFAETLQRVKDEYLSVRRRHLYQTHGVDNLEPAPYNVLVPEFTAASYFVPGDDVLGTSWTNPMFDDSQWTVGDTGLGFEDTPRNFTDLLHTRVKPTEIAAGGTSIYTRIPFTVEDVSQLDNLTLRMKYDDGFVAYLNGVEVARSGTRTSGEQTFESRATSRSNTLAVEFENFVLSEHLDKLQNGKNVLAIHVINASPTNNDLLLVPELIDGIILNTDVAGIPHEQTNDISIEIGSTLDYAPASGNEDEEYFVLVNPNPFAVDVSGWSIAGSVATTLDPGTVIGSGQSLYLTPDPSAFRARATSPTGAEGHLVQALTGHLPNQGGALQLLDATGRTVNTLQYIGGGQSPQRDLRITEINYNPHDAMPAFGELDTANDNFEFIEITNTGDADVDLTGMKLVEIDVAADTQGVAYAFAGGSLAAGERIVVVKNATAFASRYGSTVPVAGEFTGRLSNGGETLTLLDTASDVIHQFSYDDSVAWPTLADGRGGTLEVINAQGDYNDPLNWQSSFQLGGSPGAASPSISTDVVINELLTNTALPEVDQIELFNAGEAPIDVGGWYLTDGNNLTKFRITGPNTILAPGQYLVFNETELGFGFNGSSDDDARLIRPDANGRPVSYADVVDFGPTLPGVSIGRVPNGTGAWHTLNSTSFGAPNVGGVLTGDLDGNGIVNANDIDLLCRAIRFDQQVPSGDLNSDDTLNEADFELLIGTVLATTPGDANLDGSFTSSDLVLVFQAGQYEDEVADNSGWATGDWNCDGEFGSADLVSAFQAGSFVAAAQPKAITADAIDAVFTHATWRRMRRETLGRRSE
ncbi:MAG: CotH kinase family protein, partial [Planctomycetales bacterium]|nr:CotH kinase family protein [Planctomycetales bacterium]